MAHISIISLNVCTIQSQSNLSILLSFLKLHMVDVALLQEVATPAFNFPGYEELVNLGPRRRGTAILFRTGVQLSDVIQLPSGRALSARLGDVTIVNVYAPSGTQGRKERDRFFEVEVAPLLASAGDRFVWGGDFNAVLSGAETTGTAYPCLTLKRIVSEAGLKDAWKELRPSEPGFTYVAPRGACASRLDRFYLSTELHSTAQHIDILPCTVSDHHALLLTVDLPIRSSGGAPTGSKRSQWKLDPAILQHEAFTSELAAVWTEWRRKKNKSPTVVSWWEDCKRRLRGFCSSYSRQMREDTRALLQFRSECLSELYAKPRYTPEDVAHIKKHKAAINTLLLRQMGGVLERAKCSRPCPEEEPSVYHVVSRLKRARQNTIHRLHGEGGAVYDTQEAIEGHVLSHFEALLSRSHATSTDSSPFLEEVEKVVTEEDNEALLAPITIEELKEALIRSPKRKSPGDDGLTADFYLKAFDVLGEDMLEVFNAMLAAREVAVSHTTGILVLVPKIAQPREIGNLRPVTLLNADGKVFSRILTGRLATLETQLLHPMQVRAGAGRGMYDELTDIRDAIGLVNLMNRGLRRRCNRYKACLVAMDFAGAFNNVNHAYMWEVLRRRGVSEDFIRIVQSMYSNATTRIRVNGHLTVPLLLLRGIRQGCPISMLMFNILMAPLIRMLDRRLRGLELPRADAGADYAPAYRIAASAYVDDAVAVLTEEMEAATLLSIMDDFGDVSGLYLNISKTKALPLGGWDQRSGQLPFGFVDGVKILGVTFTKSVEAMEALNWKSRLGVMRASLADARLRVLPLCQRVYYVNTYVLSLMWHLAQVVAVPAGVAADIEKSIRYFLWTSSGTFKVPLTVLARPVSEGGLALQHPRIKAGALFASRWLSSARAAPMSFSGAWLRILLQLYPTNQDVPNDVCYYKDFRGVVDVLNMPTTSGRKLAQDTYALMLQERCPHPPHVALRDPAFPWDQVWATLGTRSLTAAERSAFYVTVTDVVKTNARVHRINKALDPRCAHCGVLDDVKHRLTRCTVRARQHWDTAAARVAYLLGVDVVSNGLIVRPALGKAVPKEKREQVAKILARHVLSFLNTD